MRPLIAPSKQADMEVKLIKIQVIKERPEPLHHPPRKSVIIFVLDLADQVKVTTEDPKTDEGGTCSIFFRWKRQSVWIGECSETWSGIQVKHM
jgi:hypothetical protein